MNKILLINIFFTSICFGSNLEISIPPDSNKRGVELSSKTNSNEWEKYTFEGNILTNNPIVISKYEFSNSNFVNGGFNSPLDAILSWYYLLSTNKVDSLKKMFSSYDSNTKNLASYCESSKDIKAIQPILALYNFEGIDVIYFYLTVDNDGSKFLLWDSLKKMGSGYALTKNNSITKTAPIISRLYLALGSKYIDGANSLSISASK